MGVEGEAEGVSGQGREGRKWLGEVDLGGSNLQQDPVLHFSSCPAPFSPCTSVTEEGYWGHITQGSLLLREALCPCRSSDPLLVP